MYNGTGYQSALIEVNTLEKEKLREKLNFTFLTMLFSILKKKNYNDGFYNHEFKIDNTLAWNQLS